MQFAYFEVIKQLFMHLLCSITRIISALMNLVHIEMYLQLMLTVAFQHLSDELGEFLHCLCHDDSITKYI